MKPSRRPVDFPSGRRETGSAPNPAGCRLAPFFGCLAEASGLPLAVFDFHLANPTDQLLHGWLVDTCGTCPSRQWP